MFLTTNNGANWTAVNSGLTNTKVRSLSVLGNNLFAGTYGDGVFRSTDNGANWSEVNTGLTSDYIYSLLFSDSNLFAGTLSGIFISTNRGQAGQP